MSNSQWHRVEELFHEALKLEPCDRKIYLRQECSENSELHDEVLSLLEASENEKTFIEQPAIDLGLKVMYTQEAGSLVDQVIGHYKILRLLGSGGMGEVYLAEDLTLDRHVALKFLACGFGNDAWAKAQFRREAKAVAQLENPNICAIHRIEEIDGRIFIEMQYVEGRTLQSVLRESTLELDRALDFAEQIANALAAAHLRGIIHRDVKTQNIMVTPGSNVKVLDFGLAQLVIPTQSLDRSSPIDQTSLPGVVVGTIAYMSPEQTRGENLDVVSDVFSFGIVLNEMASGFNPFLRQTKEETISAIQKEEPQLNPHLPAPLLSIIHRCLAKNRENRYENAEQIRVDLHALNQSRRPKELPTWLGRRRLKYYAVGAALFMLMALVGSGFVYQKISRVHSLALVQIENQSGDPNLGFLSQGLTRNLYDKFNYLPRLKVKLPANTQLTTDKSVDVVRSGRDWNVESVLTGQVIKRDGSAFLLVRLSNTKDGSVLWEQSFDTSKLSLFTIQDEITKAVVSNLGLWLIGSEQKRLGRHQTDNEEALRNYMFGRDYWSKRSQENIKKAAEFFEKAKNLDPAFAESYSGLSDCYALMNTVAYGSLSTSEVMSKARWNAEQAIAINDSLAEAHTSLGIVALRYQWEWQKAETEFRRAIQIDPNYAPAYFWYSLLLSALSRHEEAVQQSELARQLDPYSPLAKMNYGRSLYYARRSNEALYQFDELLQQNPESAQALHMRGLTLIQTGKYSEAITTLDKLHQLNPLHAAAALGYAYGKEGRTQEALSILREIEAASVSKPLPAQERVLINIGIGRTDEAFLFLNQSFDQRFASMAFLNVDSLYDDLRSDPRFTDLTKRVGLPPQ